MHLIKIRNFGPIKNCEMEIKKFTVLTGPQAEGKSTIAKAIYYFLRVKEIFREQIIKNKDANLDSLTNFLRTKFFATFGNSVANSSSMRLEYFYKAGTWIFINAVEKSDGQIFVDFQFSENFKQFIKENSHSDLIFWDNEENRNKLKIKLENFFEINFKPIYIPAGRSTIASLTDYISEIFIRSNVMENRMVERNIGSCITDYVLLILMLRGMFFTIEQDYLLDNAISSDSKVDINLLNDFVKLSRKILKGKYIFKKGEEFLITENKNSVYTKMSFASSGQQEIVWVCNIMFFYLYQAIPTFLILEEPEAHLYPDSQKNISDLISLFVNVGNNVLITTHSPYILGEFNNLLFANEIKNSKEEINNLIKNTRLLPYEDSQAFYIADGIKNEGMEEHLICNELIDGASNDINELNDKLLELKWTMEKK